MDLYAHRFIPDEAVSTFRGDFAGSTICTSALDRLTPLVSTRAHGDAVAVKFRPLEVLRFVGVVARLFSFLSRLRFPLSVSVGIPVRIHVLCIVGPESSRVRDAVMLFITRRLRSSNMERLML